MRKVVANFTTSPKEERSLQAIQVLLETKQTQQSASRDPDSTVGTASTLNTDPSTESSDGKKFKPLKVKKFCVTRWSGAYSAMNRIVRLKASLVQYFRNYIAQNDEQHENNINSAT